jgi:hypothetical protein
MFGNKLCSLLYDGILFDSCRLKQTFIQNVFYKIRREPWTNGLKVGKNMISKVADLKMIDKISYMKIIKHND